MSETHERSYEIKVRYNVELSLEDISLVEKYNDSGAALFFDPLLIHILKCYFKLLGKEKYNTLEISDAEYIRNIVSLHEGTEEAKWIQRMSDPVVCIAHAINCTCDAVGLYRTFNERPSKKELAINELQKFVKEMTSTFQTPSKKKNRFVFDLIRWSKHEPYWCVFACEHGKGNTSCVKGAVSIVGSYYAYKETKLDLHSVLSILADSGWDVEIHNDFYFFH